MIEWEAGCIRKAEFSCWMSATLFVVMAEDLEKITNTLLTSTFIKLKHIQSTNLWRQLSP